MSKKLMLLAMGAFTALAFAALPSMASAGDWKLDCPNGATTCNYSVAGGHAEIRIDEEPTITCTTSTGSGTVSSGGTTGTIGLALNNCVATSVFTFECHTSGSALGEVNIGNSVWHNIYLRDDKTDPGTLVTPTKINLICGGIIELELTGNGVVGNVPQACNSESSTLTVNFEASLTNNRTQRYEQNTQTGTLFDLHAVTPGFSTVHTAVLITSTSASFVGKDKITCI
jgi:hypothetical protein